MDAHARRGGATTSSRPCSATSGSSPRARPAPSSGCRSTAWAQGTVPDAHDPSKRHAPTMLTTDLALRLDPVYEKISRRFLEHPDEFARGVRQGLVQADAPRHGARLSRYLGPLVPAEPQLWQDPVPAVDHELIGEEDVAALKAPGPRVGPVGLAAGLDRLGVRGDVPRHRQARRGQRGAHPPRAAEGLGGQQPAGAGDGARRPSRASRRRSTTHRPAGNRCRWPT